jgi:hypothetical protein
MSKFGQVHVKPILLSYLSKQIRERLAKLSNTLNSFMTVQKRKSSTVRFLRQRKTSEMGTGLLKSQGGAALTGRHQGSNHPREHLLGAHGSSGI